MSPRDLLIAWDNCWREISLLSPALSEGLLGLLTQSLEHVDHSSAALGHMLEVVDLACNAPAFAQIVAKHITPDEPQQTQFVRTFSLMNKRRGGKQPKNLRPRVEALQQAVRPGSPLAQMTQSYLSLRK